jgi:hypothetical protein
VQEIELWLLAAAVLAVIVVWAMRSRATVARHPVAFASMLGVVPGILGAVLVLVPRTDLVPDAAEPYLWIAIVLAASGAVIVALTIAVVRH